MHRHRIAAAVLSACALGAAAPSTGNASAGPPRVDIPEHCFLVAGPPDGPIDPLVGMTLCLVREVTGG